MLVSLINIVIICLCSRLLFKNIKPGLPGAVFTGALVFKLASGILLGLLYFRYYGHGDTITYHQQASDLVDLALTDLDSFFKRFFINPPLNYEKSPRAWLMVQITTIFHLLTDKNYWMTACWFSFYAFSGLYFLCSRIIKVWPEQQMAVTIAFLFFPSVVFWSSGVIKESLALGTLGFLFGFFITYSFVLKRSKYLLICLFLILFLWFIKYYIAAVWIVVFIPVIFLLKSPGKNLAWMIIIFALIMLTGITFTHPNFYPDRFIDIIFNNYKIYHELSQPNEAMTYPYDKADLFFIILNAPIALFTALFMPILYFSLQLPVVFAVTENIIIFILFVGWIFSRKKMTGVGFNKIMKYSLWLYIIVLAIFLALSVPNFGTLSRFRVSFLPFFIWLILTDNYILDKIKNNLSRYTLWIKNR